ncbi:barstar family protein [Streptomyces sp. cg36]|uniref:barstar family protein n=1 Tax=Streptomyces sp. cg36 TaxID=3238798 RepID=UPI0034E25C2B
MTDVHREESAPLYSLYSVDDERELFTVGDLSGFFVDADDDWRTFRALRCAASGRPAAGEVDELKVRVLDSRGGVLGSYDVSAVHIEEAEEEGQPVLEVTGYLLSRPHPLAPAAWDRWREPGELRAGAWASLPAPVRRAWLDCVRLHHFAAPRRTGADVSGGVYELDGRHITDWVGLYCALGEALRGPGGYFGGTLDALRDCLNGGFGVRAPFQLNWHSVATARAHLGDGYVDDVVETIRSAGATVTFP